MTRNEFFKQVRGLFLELDSKKSEDKLWGIIKEITKIEVVKERDILTKTIQNLREELTRRDKVEKILTNQINRMAEFQKPVYETSGEIIKINSPKNFPD